MKLTTRLQLWDLKREMKSYESKIRLIKAVIKEIKKNAKHKRNTKKE